MIRSEILKSIAPIISNELVICNIGLPSQELYMIDDQSSNFYMLGTMGLASSIVLTNFGTFPTIANNTADNFILFIIDNGSYGSTGDQPTYAGQRTSLAGVAKECGCENVFECKAENAKSTLQLALASNKKTIIVCKCDSGNIPVGVIGLDPGLIRHRFMGEVAARNSF